MTTKRAKAKHTTLKILKTDFGWIITSKIGLYYATEHEGRWRASELCEYEDGHVELEPVQLNDKTERDWFDSRSAMYHRLERLEKESYGSS